MGMLSIEILALMLDLGPRWNIPEIVINAYGILRSPLGLLRRFDWSMSLLVGTFFDNPRVIIGPESINFLYLHQARILYQTPIKSTITANLLTNF